jgi:transposase
MRRHFKNLSKSPVLPNQEIASVFIGLIDDLFPNYHQLQISNDIETYKQWAFKFKKRKISGGSRSLERFGDTANLLTVVQTCRSQKRSVIDFLASAIKAHTRNQIIFPSIIPCSAT